MKRAVIYVTILGIVCTALGIAVGIAIEKRYTSRHLPQIVREHLLRHPRDFNLLRREDRLSPKERLRARAENIFERIDRELGLSSEQRDEVKAISEQAKQEIEQVQDEFRTQVIGIRDRSNAEILEILSPTQKEKFKRMIAEIKEGRQRGMRRR